MSDETRQSQDQEPGQGGTRPRPPAPRSLGELIRFLEKPGGGRELTFRSPVKFSGHMTETHELFLRYEHGKFWVREVTSGRDHFLPIGCNLTSAETGLEFNDSGFNMTKFGVTIEVTYGWD